MAGTALQFVISWPEYDILEMAEPDRLFFAAWRELEFLARQLYTWQFRPNPGKQRRSCVIMQSNAMHRAPCQWEATDVKK